MQLVISSNDLATFCLLSVTLRSALLKGSILVGYMNGVIAAAALYPSTNRKGDRSVATFRPSGFFRQQHSCCCVCCCLKKPEGRNVATDLSLFLFVEG